MEDAALVEAWIWAVELGESTAAFKSGSFFAYRLNQSKENILPKE